MRPVVATGTLLDMSKLQRISRSAIRPIFFERIAVAAVCVTVLLTVACKAPAPGVEMSELASSVTIVRDTWGVPHIYAPTDAGVVYGAAWAQAEDNWWQVEDNFLRALGRASEIYGEEKFLDDYLVRAMEIQRRSQEEYERAPSDIRALYDAYAAGFNDFLEHVPDVERRLLDRVEPWYTLALIRFKYHHNEYLGYAGVARRGTEMLLERPDFGPTGEAPTGSNQIAIAGSRTASGHAMLLINPHVGFFGLSQYLEIHLHSDEGLVFSGLSRYGFMLPYMGNSDVLGWAYTDNYADIGDLYLLSFDDPEDPLSYRYGDGRRRATEWRETIGIRTDSGVEQREVVLRRSHHGPIVEVRETEDGTTVPVAVRLARLDEGGWFDQWYRMMRARSLDEFQRALSVLNVAYMNTMYADREGNIYYVYNSAVPKRDPAYDWRSPVDGSDPGTEWDGYHTLDELPQVLNPESGWLQNTNSTPLECTTGLNWKREDFPPYMIGRERYNPRARSATRVADALAAVTLDDFASAVLDTRLSAADELLPGLFEAHDTVRRQDPARGDRLEEAVAALRGWDRVASIESTATTLFVEWAATRPRDDEAWDRLAALEDVLKDLESTWGSQHVAWGELNRAQRPDAAGIAPFDDALASTAIPGAPGWTGSLFTYTARPAPDGKRRYGVHGNSFVKVIELGETPQARSILTFGQNGDPASPHYLDQLPIYATKGFKPAWFDRAAVEANAEMIYSPGDSISH